MSGKARMNYSLTIASLLGGAAVYLVFAACGQTAAERRLPALGDSGSNSISPVRDAAAQMTSGSRLRARYLVSDDGARSFVGWYDSARSENCSFMPAPDGVTRCLPFVPAQVSKLLSGAFGDSTCTRRIAQRQASPNSCTTTAPMFAYESIGTVCAPAFRYYDWAELYDGPVYSIVNGACVAGSSAPNEFYVGQEVPASTWAAYASAIEQHE